jgi:hypothetical protein
LHVSDHIHPHRVSQWGEVNPPNWDANLHIFAERNRMIENYGKDKTEAQLDWLLGAVMNNTIDEQAIALAGLGVVNSVLDFFEQFGSFAILDFLFNCTEIIGTNYSFCDVDMWGTGYNCSDHESAEAICAIIAFPDVMHENPLLNLALLEASGMSVNDVLDSIRGQAASTLDAATSSLYPNELYMITVPMGFVIFFAVFTALQLAISYLPSVTTTIIQLRTGVVPSLGNSDFQKYRVAPDTVTLLTGTLFWGCLVSSILFGTVVGSIVFMFLWQGSIRLAQRLIVIAIGVIVILIIRSLVSAFTTGCAFSMVVK